MEERAFQNQRILKRRLMEVQGGGEVRKLHIVYFLTRNCYTQHPHLIRVHHISRNGVRLRDIKRWLGELRGKDMPESFSWSYKRRYNTGYVWQDLVDDDLITPISDNEYVLKGSEIMSNINNIDLSQHGEKLPMQKEQSSIQESATDNKMISFKEDKQSLSSETSIYISTKSSSEIEESSPTCGSETSSSTDDSRKLKADDNSVINQQEKPQANSALFRSNTKRRTKKVKIDQKIVSSKAASLDKHHFTKSKSCSDGASHMFRNFITCGAVDTNDSALVMSRKQRRPFFNMCSSNQRDVRSAEMYKRENLGSSQMIFQSRNSTQHQWSNSKGWEGKKDSAKKKGEIREQRVPYAASKPLNGPNCSQCGKSFKPEKLLSHMKSCKGKKASANGSNSAIFSAENASNVSAELRDQDSASAYFLTY